MAKRRRLSKPVIKKGRHTDVKTAQDGHGNYIYRAYLKTGTKTIIKIEANASAYHRLLAAVDLWVRGASISDVERAIGKHIDT